MARKVVITGLGPVSGLGLGIAPTWARVVAGRGAIDRVQAFDPSGFECQIGSEVSEFKLSQYVPKSYRKATKVMARDIGLAVAAADYAARDAGLVTRGTEGNEDTPPSYDPARVGAHIGAGLIAAELDELTAALAEAVDEHGAFDYHKWGREGITHLTPLWLLKYLPNMLACHVTIIHDAQGPSNTITCGEASGLLSIGESLRVIQRGAADMCFCGGVESKINPMAYLRRHMTGRLNVSDNNSPETAVRPFSKDAAGTVVGEGGGIVTLESAETLEQRRAAASGDRAPAGYAELAGFGASQSINIEARNLKPDPAGRSIASAIQAAMREAGVRPDQIGLIIPFGAGVLDCDQAEAAALQAVFGGGLEEIPVVSTKSLIGTCDAGCGGLDACVAAMAVAKQTVPAVINCDQPLSGLCAGTAASREAVIDSALVYSAGIGGQNAALVLKRLT